MPPRRSARVAHGRGRGRGDRGRGRGRGNNDQEADNEAVVGENNGHDQSAAAGGTAAAGATAAGAVPVAPAMTFTKWTSPQVEKFDGSGSPTDAADWLRKVEKVMDGCRMTPKDKVFFIPLQLTSLADLWWDGVRDAWPPSRGPITWEIFLEQFRAKYYPESFKDRMSDALNHIQQGSKTVDEYEREFTNIVRFVPSVARDEHEKARKFFRGLNAWYREVMGRNPPTTYLAAVEEARGMESEIQLTVIQQNRSGSVSGTGGDKKRAPHEEGERESSQRPPFKKFKQNHNTQSFKPRQSGGQSSSSSRPAEFPFMHPVPGQGLKCFKCGKPHHASHCTFSGTCRTCGKDGHMAIVCKRNPDSIIKWQRSSPSVSSPASSRGSAPSVGGSHGVVHMMAAPPVSHQHYPQQYMSLPTGYYWHPQQLPTSQVPPQLPAPHVLLQLPAPSSIPPHQIGAGSC
ncbi:unnamed protein product [Urochloa humidicola]